MAAYILQAAKQNLGVLVSTEHLDAINCLAARKHWPLAETSVVLKTDSFVAWVH